MCAHVLGHVPPANRIACGLIRHVVDDGDPPLVLLDGEAVREISMAYNYEDYSHELRI